MIQLPKDNNITNQIIKFSRINEIQIREEFKKLVNYYNSNTKELLDNMLEIKALSNNDDYYSDKIYDGANDIVDNINLNGECQYKFDENLFLDSLDKINRQILNLPDNVSKNNKEVTIYFYDLLDNACPSGSRIVISSLILPWETFIESYKCINN